MKLRDVDDGTQNRYVPFAKYLNGEVQKACELAHAFETKLIRGFSFYHPRGTDPPEHYRRPSISSAKSRKLATAAT